MFFSYLGISFPSAQEVMVKHDKGLQYHCKMVTQVVECHDDITMVYGQCVVHSLGHPKSLFHLYPTIYHPLGLQLQQNH